jgi:rubrerythrin
MSVGYLAKCARKRRHATQALAEKQRQGLIRAGKWRGDNSNTYWCNQCGHWHAGHLNGSPRGQGKRPAKNTPRHLASQ